VATAEWASRLAGQERRYEPSFSQSGGGFSQNWSLGTKERFLPDEFRMLPRATPATGIHYVFLSPYSGVVKSHLPGERVAYLQPPVSQVPSRIDKPNPQYEFPFWDPEVVPGQTLPPASYQAFVASGANELEQAIRHHVWMLLQQMSDQAVYDFFFQQKRP
jgi:hypothetical protein